MTITKPPIAIIIGATSGIGRALAVELSRRGYAVGVAGRRVELLASLRAELAGPSAMAAMDVTQPEAAVRAFEGLIAELGGVDLVVVNAGVGITNPELDWPCELQTIAVNVSGFVVLATAAYRYFAARGGGHLAGITSIAGLRGSRFNPAYGASKAFDISYLEALRARARFEGHAIAVTDIRPGFVDTPMTEGQRGMFWVATAERAARRIADALRRKARVAYITRRWALPAWVLKWAPGWLLDRV